MHRGGRPLAEAEPTIKEATMALPDDKVVAVGLERMGRVVTSAV
jgi:hypothetical protein